MSANEQTPVPAASAKRPARRLRIIGIVVLLLGIGGAGVDYWLGTRTADAANDLSMVGYNKAQERQMGILYGKQGDLIENWSNALKQPGTQAVIIIAVSVLVASGCFYTAWLSGADDETH